MRGVIVLDTNLLLLLTVGLANREYVTRHKRLQSFDAGDFDLLLKVVRGASGVILIPHVLAETSNLARYCKDTMRFEIASKLGTVISDGTEHFLPSRVAVSRPEYLSLGLTDAVLLETTASGGTLMTADFDLYWAALTAGMNVENFSHIKEQRAGFQ